MPTDTRLDTLPTAWNFTSTFDLDPIERVRLIKQGAPATVPGVMARRMGVSKERLYATLGLPRATVERKASHAQVLSPDESARVLGISRLIGQVQRMVEASGRAEEFDAAGWVARWLERPLPALDGLAPATLMDTSEGQQLVANLLSRAQTGAYA
jgi:putative toxin-antitoxin system antitoxin component (TIGR02293 family)